ncbi:MAG: amidohydrolase family protein, partial [Planctomycetota bacterium]
MTRRSRGLALQFGSILLVAGMNGNLAAEVTAIINVRIDTRSEAGVIESGVVVIRDGVIEGVGAEVDVPEGAVVVDGEGATLTPGLIDSQSRLWLTPTSRGDTSSTAALRTVDGLDPFDRAYLDVARQGVTSVSVAPQDRGRLGGSVALLSVAQAEDAFAIPSRESFQKEKEDAESTADAKESEKAPTKKSQPSDAKPQKATERKPVGGSAATRLSTVRRLADVEDPEKKEAKKDDSADSNSSKNAEQKATSKEKKDGDDKSEDDEKIEVPYSITRPPVPYSTGKTGWVLGTDIAVQASLGIAATDGRSRISEFEALKKTLTDAEAYHKKWDEYRSWKAKQDKLPPEKRAKAAPKKPMSRAEQQRAAFIAMMRARGARVATPKPPEQKESTPKQEPSKESPSKSSDGKDEKKEDEKVVPKPDFDPAKDRLRPVLKGEIPLRMNIVDRASLERALKLTEIADCQLILVGATRLDGEALEEVNWPMIVGPWLQQDEEVLRDWKAQFDRDDIRVVLGSFGSDGSDSGTLRMQAAAAVNAGVDPNRVMDAVTRSAAEVAGVGDWLGQIKPGYRADLSLFAGDPLDPATPVLRTMVGGKTVFASSVKPTTTEGLEVVKISDAIEERFSELTMPSSYVLASNRILRPSGRFRSGRLTVVDGVIKAVVLDPLPGDAASKKKVNAVDDQLPVLQLGDLVLTPGLVSGHVSLSGGTGTGEPDSSYYQAVNGFDFQSTRARSMIESGVLFAGIAPPSSNVFAGQISAVRLAAKDPVLSQSIA